MTVWQHNKEVLQHKKPAASSNDPQQEDISGGGSPSSFTLFIDNSCSAFTDTSAANHSLRAGLPWALGLRGFLGPLRGRLTMKMCKCLYVSRVQNVLGTLSEPHNITIFTLVDYRRPNSLRLDEVIIKSCSMKV